MSQHRRKRRYYLEDIPLDEAVQRFHAALRDAGWLQRSPAEDVLLDQASWRVTAEPVWAKSSSPHYDASAMDGVAVRSRETVGATETAPVRLTVGEQAVWLDTGDPMPDGYDAVAMVEVVHQVDEATIELQSPIAPYQHVRPLGEDIVATELVLPVNHRLRPQDLAACAAAGLSSVDVRRTPTVAVIPTGTELVSPGSQARPGEIVESNSLMLSAMIDDWGGHATRWDPVPDDYEQISAAVRQAVRKYDIVVVNAGSSAGSEDYTAKVVEGLGQLVVHGVAVRPGHPVVLGVIDDKPFIGIPGYPVSAALTCELFVRPLIEARLGIAVERRDKVTATVTRKVSSPMGEDEFLRVRLGVVAERMVATPVQRGAGVIMSLVRADGLALIPRFSEGIAAGEEVEVELLRPLEAIEHAIVATGSHDVSLDLLASEVHRRHPGASLVSSNVGSLGGLTALKRGEAHLAGCHLMDEETGEYNVPYVKRYLRDRDVVLVRLVGRTQGLIVQEGNPQSITSLEDLVRRGVTFVNRQRGSGTRLLLDHTLKGAGIRAKQIDGYEREEYTHLAVAAAVAGGRAAAGLGVLSAARALGLDFVPLADEQYDLVIPVEFYESRFLAPLLELIVSEDFKQQVDSLGGYDTSRTGEVIAEIGSS